MNAALATADQDAIEARALAILGMPAMQAAIDAVRVRYRKDPLAETPGGAATLDAAVAELAWAGALVGVNTDPARPRIAWVYSAPRAWHGRQVPGSRWGVDNPDNVYRIAPIDGVSRYLLRAASGGRPPAQFSFLTYSHFVGEDGHEGEVDKPLGGLRSDDIVLDADGGFTLTIDPAPADGRPNHIRTTPDTRQLLIRNTMGDWTAERPLALAIERAGGPDPGPAPDDQALAANAAKFLAALATLSLAWKRDSLFGFWRENTLCTPYGRGMQWGYAASGNFDLADDEALVVTIDPLGAGYLGFSVTDPWLASLDHVDRQGSLNGSQAVRDAAGTYTYVIAARDPGFHNWLDTGGLAQGSMLFRWQLVPPGAPSDAAVKQVERVRLADLRAALPPDARFITPAERAVILARRAGHYRMRYEETAG